MNLQEADQERLFACLRQIMERSAEFGGGPFALAASVLTDLIHHDPMVYASLDKAGLPDAFIASIKVRFDLPSRTMSPSFVLSPYSRSVEVSPPPSPYLCSLLST